VRRERRSSRPPFSVPCAPSSLPCRRHGRIDF
ncbi:uncharacterized, partial [Tachysurus ichikawai]